MPILACVLRAASALSFNAQRWWAERIFEPMWPATLEGVTDEAIPHAAVALAVARTCGMHGVQKRASYELLRMPALMQSIAGADADLGTIPHADLLRLLRAREFLGHFWAKVAGQAPIGFPCVPVCEDRTHARWAELVHASGIFVKRLIDPLMGLQDLVEIPWGGEGYCKKCVRMKVNEWAELRRELWDYLDVLLELTTE